MSVAPRIGAVPDRAPVGRFARWFDFDNISTALILLFFALFLMVPFVTILIVSFTGKPVAVLDLFTGIEGMRKLGHDIGDNASLR